MYPSFQQFNHWAGRYTAVPMWLEPELPTEPVLDWAHTLLALQQRFFFLHSAASSGPQSRYSAFALESPRFTADVQEGSLVLRYHGDSSPRGEALKVGNPLARFHEWFSRWTSPRVDSLPPFWGGAYGYLGYESSRYLEPKLEELFSRRRSKTVSLAVERFSDFEFSLYDMVAVVDHARNRLWIVHTVLLPEGKKHSPIQLEKIYRNGQDRLRRQAVRLQRALHHPRSWAAFHASDVRSNRSEAAYRLMVRRAKGFIAAGDIYQSNLSQIFSAGWEGDPWTLYSHLTAINPSPYAALWRSGSRWMASASPELLIRREAERVETRPIAGTYARRPGGDDETIALALAADAKERAEHVMLLDLERNDLSRICQAPSVRVAEALTPEIYSHVIHLVSDVRGTLRPGVDWRDVLAACFPGGTITGCPKLRCMELIDRLEPQRRGPYTGALGWIGFTGDMTFNLLIRSFFMDQGRLSFPVGAGIIADSDPAREYQETLHKAQALLQALHLSSLLKLPPRRTL